MGVMGVIALLLDESALYAQQSRVGHSLSYGWLCKLLQAT
ncbi:hypothetical protein PS914_03200 [Pseudomonas fluorescens]|nr:hypothetical protein PS914_03200 [Pseudomonas fluorescens]